jgi:hypothetical protein
MYAINIQNDVIGLVLCQNGKSKQVTDFIAWPSRCHDTILYQICSFYTSFNVPWYINTILGFILVIIEVMEIPNSRMVAGNRIFFFNYSEICLIRTLKKHGIVYNENFKWNLNFGYLICLNQISNPYTKVSPKEFLIKQVLL